MTGDGMSDEQFVAELRECAGSRLTMAGTIKEEEMMVTWRKMLDEEIAEHKDTLIGCTLSGAALDVEFDAGHGGEEGKPFTAWGEKNVYFPICYDGAEWVGYAPRNPCDTAMNHQGGG